MTDAPHGPAPTVADHRYFTELLERGLTLREVAAAAGFSYGQVRGAVHRHRLRQGPSPRRTSPFTPKQKARMRVLAIQRVEAGVTLPAVAEEIAQRTGKLISASALRRWIPARLDEQVRENARQAKVIHNRKVARRYHDDVAKLKAKIEELERVNQSLREALRARRRQAESGECPGHGKCDDPGCPAHYAPSEEVV